MTNGTSGNDLNVALILQENVPSRLEAARAERSSLVARVLELSQEIAMLETHQLLGSDLKREEENGNAK